MKVEVHKILNSEYATQYSKGELLWKVLNQAPYPDRLIISFLGIEFLSTVFLSSSIGKYTLQHPLEISKVKFIYPEDKPIFKLKVEDVIENALLGDEYDALVENAIYSW